MSPEPKRTRRRGLSRRDFVQGRFWRTLGLNRPSRDEPTESTKLPPRRSLVMRYPNSLRDVAAVDSPENAPEVDAGSVPTTSAPATEARRRTIPVLRPPGAIDEASFLARCTRCDLCVQACPHDAIIHAPPRLREAALTPMIDPDRQPCMMCEDFPCIAACEPEVLTPLISKMMGTAKVTEHLCLAHHGTTCTVCSERCPVAGAIDLCDGKPMVNETACTGCGVCRYVCPAPENAILLMPTYLRPSLPTKPLP